MRVMIMRLFFALAAFTAISNIASAQEGGEVHKAAPVGSYGGLMNPDVSAILNTKFLFSDHGDDPHRNKLYIEEAEIAFQSYLYPGIHGDFIIAMHQHEGEWEVHPEEAYVSFLDLPLGFQAVAGRKLVGFGRLNQTHPHHWKFAGRPLTLDNFFGTHAWFDDGVQIDWLVPNPWDFYFKVGLGAWSGETLEHHHHEEGGGEEGHGDHQTVQWCGKVFNSRASFDMTIGELSNLTLGYSAAWDEGIHTLLHGVDLTLNYRRPISYNRIKLSVELYAADVEDEHMSDPLGFFSMLSVTLNQYWELGARYDRSEFFHHVDEEEQQDFETDNEWGVSAFITYYFTHSMYIRPEYTHSANRFNETENRVVIQLVWGLGPHAHRIED